MPLALVLAAWAASQPPQCTVAVSILSHHHPARVQLAGPQGAHHVAQASGGRLFVDGHLALQPFATGPGPWRVRVPLGQTRSYPALLSIRADGNQLLFTAAMALEDYVARVVAAETLVGTHPVALQAQAIVARSYALASPARHARADLCDLAHCQVLGTPQTLNGDHLAASVAAAQATAGKVLWLGPKRIAETPFHAACGGHTADPVEVFGGNTTGAASVQDPGCPEDAWRATLERTQVEAVAGALLAPAAPWVDVGALTLVWGAGGHVRQVVNRATGASAPGDAFARALDRAAGYGVVRSGRFVWQVNGNRVLLQGTGHGHGVGLCQTGAQRWAASGKTPHEILRHYFPQATVGPLRGRCHVRAQ